MAESWKCDTVEHKSMLQSATQWLDDAIVNDAQNLLQSERTASYNIAWVQFFILYHEQGFVQILHNGEDYWLTVCTLGLTSVRQSIPVLYRPCHRSNLFYFVYHQQCGVSRVYGRLSSGIVACIQLLMLQDYAAVKMFHLEYIILCV